MVTTINQEERRKSIGASEMYNILPTEWGCERRLYYEKRDVEADYPFVETDDIRRGIVLEPFVAQLYTEQTGNTLLSLGKITSKDFPFITGHPDRIISSNGNPLELKCPGPRHYTRIAHNGLPIAWILQLQMYMYLTDTERGAFAIFNSHSGDLLSLSAERNDDLVEQITDAARLFWHDVEKGVEPDRLDAKDKRCKGCRWRITCQGLDTTVESNGDVVMRQDLQLLIDDYNEAVRLKKEAELYAVETGDMLKEALGNDTIIETDTSRIYYKPVESYRVNTKLLKSKYPEIAKECTVKTTTRPFRVCERRIGG